MKYKNTIIPEEFQGEEKRQKYLRAVHKMREIKVFYIHLSVYILVNLFIIATKLLQHESQNFHIGSLPVIWGVAVLIHAGSVFLPGFFLGKNWEEEKIKEIMKNEESNNLNR